MATHTNVQYDCNKYTKKFETKHDLTNHTSIHTDEQLSCKSCDEVFRTQSKFSKHIETHTQGCMLHQIKGGFFEQSEQSEQSHPSEQSRQKILVTS